MAFTFKFLSIHHILNDKQNISVKSPLAGKFLGRLLNQTPNLYLADPLEALQKERKPQTTFPSAVSRNRNNPQRKVILDSYTDILQDAIPVELTCLTHKPEIYLDL